MFHMLSCFNLKPGIAIEDFRDALASYTEHMRALDLLEATGPVGRRQSNTIMDTDSERDHQFFVTMSFRDGAQCDRSVDYIYSPATGRFDSQSGLCRYCRPGFHLLGKHLSSVEIPGFRH